MNEYDSNRILDLTKKINYAFTKKIEDADCYVLNTCHIREKATDKVYHEVGRVKKEFRYKKKPNTQHLQENRCEDEWGTKPNRSRLT